MKELRLNFTSPGVPVMEPPDYLNNILLPEPGTGASLTPAPVMPSAPAAPAPRPKPTQQPAMRFDGSNPFVGAAQKAGFTDFSPQRMQAKALRGQSNG